MAYIPTNFDIILYLRQDLRANLFEGINNPKNIPAFFSFSDKGINYLNTVPKDTIDVSDISGDGLDCIFSLAVNTSHIPTFVRPITPSIYQSFESNSDFINVLDGRFAQRTDTISLGVGDYSFTAQTNTLGTFLAEYTFNLPRDYTNEVITFNFLYSKINSSSSTWNNRISTEPEEGWAIINGGIFNNSTISGSVIQELGTAPVFLGILGARITGRVGERLKIILEERSGIQGTLIFDDFRLQGLNLITAQDNQSSEYIYNY